MGKSLLLILVLSISSCFKDASIDLVESEINETVAMTEAESIQTYGELRSYLNKRYEGIKELPVTAIIESGRETKVPFKYRLENGMEFTVPIIFTVTNERIVDPEFDFKSLPN